MSLKVFSQDTGVNLQHNIPREDIAGRRGGNGNFSGPLWSKGRIPVLGVNE